MVLILRSEELARIAYMGVHPYPTHKRYPIRTVQDSPSCEGLSSSHGLEQRRQNKPDFSEVISIGRTKGYTDALPSRFRRRFGRRRA